MAFHRRCGKRVTLTNANKTATRSISDFNNGLVLSAEPLKDDVIFEVRIDEKNHSWSGSIEVGITSCDPETTELPSCATKLRQGTWVMSGISVLKDGMSLIEFYGTDLDSLVESDQVGVCRTSQNELIFYINGESQGVAATNIPKTVYGLVNLYGRCVQVSICPSDSLEYNSNTQLTHNLDIPLAISVTNGASSLNSTQLNEYTDINDRLRFHTRCGSLVKLSPNCRTAERRRPLDEFNNGVVMTHRPLKDNEFFEIRIDKLVDKWSGSIEVGVTTHNPSALSFPATMTNMRSGTIMMSGCGILTNGKGTRRQYGEFNLDELREGDRVGMMRKGNGNLHYYINGQDQGVAATRVAQTLWGVIDLYGMTIKVTIVDRDEREQQNLVTRRNNLVSIQRSSSSSAQSSAVINSEISALSPDAIDLGIPKNTDRLTFHPVCGSHCSVTHNGRTAQRKNASDDFNNGVVLTRRPLKPNELFQVRLEKVVSKWAGSIEIGVTIHSATELEFPFTMTNVRSGTWMMTGNGVMHNGTTTIEQYGQNLDRLQVGDRVGVTRKDDGTLHFWVNGIDQGPAANNVPERVYGVIDLYGQAAQATICEEEECGSPDTINSTVSNTTLYSEPPLRFHSIHGKNARITNGGLTAQRPKALAEFNDAIVFSNRPLRQRELFEVVLESMVTHWSGNIEIGVTGKRPEEIQLTANATDLEYDTIILCGSVVFHNRRTISNNIPFDLDTLEMGTRVGVMRNGDSIHFFINGVDQGPAVECTMQNCQNLWAVVDLYGQCAQVSLTMSQPDLRAPYATSENSQSFQATSVIQPAETKHRWACFSGNVTLSSNWSIASRITGSAALSRCLVFSEHPLAVGSTFEIKITSYNPLFAGCLNIGVTDLNLCDESVRKNIPISMKRIPANVWYVSNNEVRYNSQLLQRSLASLEWLRVGDRIALELTTTRTLRVLLNSEDMNISFPNILNEVWVVAELQGSTMATQVISSSQAPSSPLRPCNLRLQDSLEFGIDALNKQDSELLTESIDCDVFEFSEVHGKNVKVTDLRSAQRIQSYNYGLVYTTKPLCKGHSISVKIDSVNLKYKGTIGIGVLGSCPQQISSFSSFIGIPRPCWIASHDFININGSKITSKYGEILEHIQIGSIITMTLSNSGILSISIGQINLEDLATGLPNHVFPVFDLYGKCDRISIINGEIRNGTPIEPLDNENENNVPHCEKGDLEVHEKEEQPLQNDIDVPENSGNGNDIISNGNNNTTNIMNRSVQESMSENLLMNISIKNRCMEARADSSSSSSCCLRESLLIQHNTNLNIQRSQSTQRFNNNNQNHPFNKDTNLSASTNEFFSCAPTSANSILTTSNRNSIENIIDSTIENNNNQISQEQLHPEEQQEQEQQHQEQQQTNLESNKLSETSIDELSRQLSLTQIDSLRSYSDFESSLPSLETRDCEYLKLICGFKRTLVLPDAFFYAKPPICYCRNCHGSENDNMKNWVHFRINSQALQPTSSSQNHNVGESVDWVKLYYMTRVDKIRQILDHGQPLAMEGEPGNSNGKSDVPGSQLILHSYPETILTRNSINTHRYLMGIEYTIHTAFEVLVRKQAICLSVGSEQQQQKSDTEDSQSKGASANAHNIPQTTMFTKEAGACILTALILKLEPLDNGNTERNH